MTQEEYALLLNKMESNELYRKSKSVHKNFQYRQFFNFVDKTIMNGKQVREEDKNGLMPEQEGFDASSARIVTYNFKDGLLQSENDEPAVEYEGHQEFWNKGLIEKVIADGGKTVEFWKDGVPFKIETK